MLRNIVEIIGVTYIVNYLSDNSFLYGAPFYVLIIVWVILYMFIRFFLTIIAIHIKLKTNQSNETIKKHVVEDLNEEESDEEFLKIYGDDYEYTEWKILENYKGNLEELILNYKNADETKEKEIFLKKINDSKIDFFRLFAKLYYTNYDIYEIYPKELVEECRDLIYDYEFLLDDWITNNY